jgi:hypothetical protein
MRRDFNLIAILGVDGDYDHPGDRHQGVGELQLGDCVYQVERGGDFSGGRRVFSVPSS